MNSTLNIILALSFIPSDTTEQKYIVEYIVEMNTGWLVGGAVRESCEWVYNVAR
jgi:hypothetical protein